MLTLKRKKLIIANSVLMLILIVGSVYAWFAVNHNNNVNANRVTITADGELQLSVTNEGNQWYSDLNLSEHDFKYSDGNYYSLNNVKFTDVSGTGDGNFLRPVLKQKNGYAEPDTTATQWQTVTANKDFLRFTLYMKANEPMTVYLGENSSVNPSVGMDHLTGSRVLNRISSSYAADLSKDIIVGAVRVSAIDSADNRLFTWIPRPEILFDAGDTHTNYADIITNNTETKNPESYKHYYLTDTFTTEELPRITTGNISSNIQLCELTDTDGDGNYTGQVDFCIWLEGCDNEARRAFVGGNFDVYLKLVSVET